MFYMPVYNKPAFLCKYSRKKWKTVVALDLPIAVLNNIYKAILYNRLVTAETKFNSNTRINT